jgi:hypothetical protein
LVPGAVNETFDGGRDLFGCPFHKVEKRNVQVPIEQGVKPL